MQARSLFVVFLVAAAAAPVGAAAQDVTPRETAGDPIGAVPNNTTLANETGQNGSALTNETGQNGSALTNETEQIASPNETDDAPPAEPIDSLTAIESTRLEDGEMVLVIRSEIPQRITLTDAGATWTGGEVPQQSYTLQTGTNRVSIPVTEVSGRVGVTIATKRVLYASVIETESPVLTGPFGRDDVQTAALAGLFAGVGVTAVIAFRRVKGSADDPERIL
jgi:hypothetical protein